MTSPGSDVVVVGGGIVGTAAAAFLAEAGARVTLIERDGLASGASGANSGIVQHPFDQVLADLYQETIGLYRDLSTADLGFRLGAEPAGLLYVSTDEAAVRSIDRSLADTFPELTREVVSGPALERLDPAVGPDIHACRVGIGYPVYPGASTYAYATLAERGGVQIRQGRTARLDLHRDHFTRVVVDGEALRCDAVLVAAGPWSPELIDPTGRWRPIRPRWGVVVEVELRDGPTHVLEGAEIKAMVDMPLAGPGGTGDPGDPDDLVDFSLVPLPGLATVGSTSLAAQPDPEAWVERILSRAATFVPRVADAPIRGARACARPQSADGRPLVGRIPGRPGLFICAGHGSWGISTGPASARLVVDEILGRGPGISPDLDPARFEAPTAS